MTRHSGVRGIIYLNAFCRDNEKDTGGTPVKMGERIYGKVCSSRKWQTNDASFRRQKGRQKKDNKKDEVQPRHKGKETVVKVVFTFHSGQFQEGRDRSHQKPGHLPTRNYQWQQKE